MVTVAEIKELLGEGYEVKEMDVVKNNGLKQKGISIGKTDERVRPTIYPNEDMTAQDVVDAYNNARIDTDAFNTNDLADKDFILTNVRPCLVNRVKNEEKLAELVHDDYADDLAIVYRVYVDAFTKKFGGDGTSSYLLRNELLNSIGVSVDELKDRAMQNVNGTCEMIKMSEMLRILGMPVGDEFDTGMYVLSNKSRTNGAMAIFDKSLMNYATEVLGEEFYVIPSSIHELIALPMDAVDGGASVLVNMIVEVNRTELAEQDILSDNAYVFRNGRLEVA